MQVPIQRYEAVAVAVEEAVAVAEAVGATVAEAVSVDLAKAVGVMEDVGVGVADVGVGVAEALPVAEVVTEAVDANLHFHFFPVHHSSSNSETNMSFSLTLQILICTDLYPSEFCCNYKIEQCAQVNYSFIHVSYSMCKF